MLALDQTNDEDFRPVFESQKICKLAPATHSQCSRPREPWAAKCTYPIGIVVLGLPCPLVPKDREWRGLANFPMLGLTIVYAEHVVAGLS